MENIFRGTGPAIITPFRSGDLAVDFDALGNLLDFQISNGIDFAVGEDVIIDVRKESEYEAEHVEDAYLKPLAYINDWVKDINPKEHFYLHCAGGYRSMIAASILD